VVVLALSACSGQSENPTTTPSPPSTPASTSTPLDTGQFTPAPSGAVDEDTGETIEPQPNPIWDAASRAAAVAAAQTAMTAFARPALDYDTWWAELSPLLTQQAQQDYAYVDPANVPATTVTGSGELVDDDASVFVASVEIPTDAGTYTLVLTRADGQAPWLASRFTPPTGSTS
jgi:hypothetical protein